MKKFCVLLIAMLSINCAEAQWEWQNPLPHGNNLNDVYFTSTDTGFAVGDCGIIMKTNNAGESWEIIELNFRSDLHSIYFIDNQTGFACAPNYILKTDDGGNSWSKVNSPWGAEHVHFPDPDTGYSIYYNDLYITTDGGDNWNFLNELYEITSNNILFFTDCSTGYAGDRCLGLLKTTDGGLNWNECLPELSNSFIYDIQFLNADTGFVVGGVGSFPYYGSHGYIYKTENSGLTWTSPFGIANDYIYSIFFVNSDLGYALGQAHVIKTIDGGNSWQVINDDHNICRSIYFTDDTTGFISGITGTLLKTIDSGLTWNGLPYGPQNSLTSVHFENDSLGFAVGSEETILKTTNGGLNWNRIYTGNGVMTSVFFTSIDTGYIVGVEGKIYKTTDQGASWSITQPVSEVLRSVYFPSPDIGYTLSDNIILKTENAGNDWAVIKVNEITSQKYTSIFFVDDTVGYVTVSIDSIHFDYGFILKTNDGGETWTRTSIINPIYSIYFPNMQTGYAVGLHGLYKTQDGGITWLYHPLASWKTFVSVYFITDDIGYVVNTDGEIYRTMNGGTDWYIVRPTKNRLNSIFFINDSTGYSVGAVGTILKTTNSGGSVPVINKKLSPARLLVYPNPATSTISFNAAISGTVFIVNMKGQLLLQSHISGTNPSMDISALPKGIYVVKAVSDKGVQVGKFIKHL